MPFENTPALSIRQPWAELIVLGRKSIEIRSRGPSYRGSLWIHTGKKEDADLEARFGLSSLFKGGFIGAVELKSIVPFDAERWETWRDRHLDQGSYKPNLFAWIISSPLRFSEPVPGDGQLGLFEVSAEIRLKLIHAYETAKGLSN